ncbi:L-rhamnose mutarotase [Cysteiniphilum halobium]|uniref:L-rhamnose mutarotase n=1 Tax=Cysteiniphilum halobium TaxID=2219059 RepID=UPI000E64F7E7|nr:L-rhamnose mutarotase [Cysteiniphilum halobium]
MKRIAEIIKLKQDKIEEYIHLHQNVPHQVLQEIKKANINNYSIFIHNDTLFAYFEYDGECFEKDMESMANSPVIQQWWKQTAPCQIPFDDRPKKQWWKTIPSVFLLE